MITPRGAGLKSSWPRPSIWHRPRAMLMNFVRFRLTVNARVHSQLVSLEIRERPGLRELLVLPFSMRSQRLSSPQPPDKRDHGSRDLLRQASARFFRYVPLLLHEEPEARSLPSIAPFYEKTLAESKL